MQQQLFLLKTPLVLALLIFTNTVISQTKTDTAKNAKPVFTSYIGPYSGGKALAGDVKKLMSLNPAIKVKDSKGVEYRVISYEITWKKREISDDIKTGKPKPIFYMVGADVKSNQLPESWRTEIGKNIKAGEEVTIAGILYTDTKKKLNYRGPDILLSIL